MTKHILFLLFSFSLFQVSAQSIKRQSINTLGQSGKINNITFHQSAGQTYNTTGSYDGKTGIRPGFQQPESFFLESITKNEIDLNIYPNPAAYTLNISNNEIINDVQLRIIDLNGKEVLNTTFSEFKTHSINCSQWANGAYTILLNNNGDNLYNSKLIISK